MKSIMEEASSIIKAIEKGWLKAGQPKEFSVKVFEEPQKNFIGITIKSAKIAIFFDEALNIKQVESIPHKPKHVSQYKPHERPNVAPAYSSHASKDKDIKEKEAHPAAKPKPVHKPAVRRELPKEQNIEEVKVVRELNKEPNINEEIDSNTTISDIEENAPVEPRNPSTIWSPEMIENINEWVANTLDIIESKDITFTVEPSHFYLKITFSRYIFEDKARERQFFSSLATLLIQMLKYQYKRPLKGYKLILTRG